MEGVFNIDVAGDILDIRAQGISPEQTQYEVWKHGELQFRLVYEINTDSPGWKFVQRQNNAPVLQSTIDEIGYKIDSYYK